MKVERKEKRKRGKEEKRKRRKEEKRNQLSFGVSSENMTPPLSRIVAVSGTR